MSDPTEYAEGVQGYAAGSAAKRPDKGRAFASSLYSVVRSERLGDHVLTYQEKSVYLALQYNVVGDAEEGGAQLRYRVHALLAALATPLPPHRRRRIGGRGLLSRRRVWRRLPPTTAAVAVRPLTRLGRGRRSGHVCEQGTEPRAARRVHQQRSNAQADCTSSTAARHSPHATGGSWGRGGGASATAGEPRRHVEPRLDPRRRRKQRVGQQREQRGSTALPVADHLPKK